MIDIPGLLDTDPRTRWKISHLKNDPWVQGICTTATTPLLSPGTLSPSMSRKYFKATMKAFHYGVKTGFKLSDVGTAPLAKRRKQKRKGSGGSDTGSSSGSSDCVLVVTSGNTLSTSTLSTSSSTNSITSPPKVKKLFIQRLNNDTLKIAPPPTSPLFSPTESGYSSGSDKETCKRQ